MLSHQFRKTGVQAVALLAFALNGCSDDGEKLPGDLFIRSVLALEPGACEVVPRPDAAMLPFGVLDTSFGGGYFAPLLVGNSLPDDVRGASLHTAVVRLQAEGGDATELTSVGTGFVPPTDGSEPGWGVMFAELVPAGFVAPEQPSVRFTVKVRVLGELAGGVGVESSELTFPISVCSGCLVAFPPQALDTTGRCVATEAEDVVPCIIGQDVAVDCRVCANTNPLCQP